MITPVFDQIILIEGKHGWRMPHEMRMDILQLVYDQARQIAQERHQGYVLEDDYAEQVDRLYDGYSGK